MSSRRKPVDQSVEKIDGRITTITAVLSKVTVSQSHAERWAHRRQRLHEARKILTKDVK